MRNIFKSIAQDDVISVASFKGLSQSEQQLKVDDQDREVLYYIVL